MRQLEGVTPPDVAPILRKYIKGKVVCDVGCGEGTFMEALRENGAAKVIGIEEDKDWAYTAASKGFEIYHGSSWFQPLPKADVYYLWTRDAMGIFLKAKHEGTKGTFIFGHTVRKSLLDFISTLDGETRYLPNPTSDGLSLNWWVFITELK